MGEQRKKRREKGEGRATADIGHIEHWLRKVCDAIKESKEKSGHTMHEVDVLPQPGETWDGGAYFVAVHKIIVTLCGSARGSYLEALPQ